MIKVTFNDTGTSSLDGRRRNPKREIVGHDAGEVMRRWNASGWYAHMEPLEFRRTLLRNSGGDKKVYAGEAAVTSLPAPDAEILLAVEAASNGRLSVEGLRG